MRRDARFEELAIKFRQTLRRCRSRHAIHPRAGVDGKVSAERSVGSHHRGKGRSSHHGDQWFKRETFFL